MGFHPYLEPQPPGPFPDHASWDCAGDHAHGHRWVVFRRCITSPTYRRSCANRQKAPESEAVHRLLFSPDREESEMEPRKDTPRRVVHTGLLTRREEDILAISTCALLR